MIIDFFSAISEAEKALSCGDYASCISFLEEFSTKHPLSDKEASRIKMLMITAWMGKGEDRKALNTCRLLSKSKDNEIRQQAKQLLSILEAPSLPRPENWSIQIPKIEANSITGNNKINNLGKKKRKEYIEYPPTGRTKAFDLGYPILVVAILTTLTIFLSH